VNWDALAAVADIVAAAAVVITLIYLAKEVRHNSRSIEIAALRDTTAQWHQWSNMIVSSSDLAEIVAKGNLGYDKLAASERLRYGAYVQTFFDNVESVWALNREYGVEKDLDVLESIVRRRITFNGFIECWSDYADDYSSEFVQWIESIRDDIGQ